MTGKRMEASKGVKMIHTCVHHRISSWAGSTLPDDSRTHLWGKTYEQRPSSSITSLSLPL